MTRLRIVVAWPWELGFEVPPGEYVFLLDDQGAYITDDEGNFLVDD